MGTWYGRKVPEARGSNDAIGVVVPHAGYVYSGLTAARAVGALKDGRSLTVLVLAPIHRMKSECGKALVSSFSGFETPVGLLRAALDDASLLVERGVAEWAPKREDEEEHAGEMMLPLIAKRFGLDIKVLLVYVCRVDEELVRTLKLMWNDRWRLVASSDWYHYGPAYGTVVEDALDHVERQEQQYLDWLGTGDWRSIERMANKMCGRAAVATATRLLGPGRLLEKSRSKEIKRQEDSVVSYVAAVFK